MCYGDVRRAIANVANCICDRCAAMFQTLNLMILLCAVRCAIAHFTTRDYNVHNLRFNCNGHSSGTRLNIISSQTAAVLPNRHIVSAASSQQPAASSTKHI